jgi:hypothetical protein
MPLLAGWVGGANEFNSARNSRRNFAYSIAAEQIRSTSRLVSLVETKRVFRLHQNWIV